MHKLLLAMGFIQLDTDPLEEVFQYFHAKHEITVTIAPEMAAAGLCDLLFLSGMAVQKAQTKQVIAEAARKLGFKF